MYEKHFGLKKKLFSSRADDKSVFVGPRQAKVIKSLGAGLTAVDSIVAVTGPVGVGKTTIVQRALQSLSPGRMVAFVGRMALAPDEVLHLLLTGFGISREASGTVQKFAAFRRLLTERAAAGAQLAIVVEDAMRVGQDALVEMEALTAADSGDATGANIILMGQPELKEWLANPALARLRQRTRLRITVEPFNAAEIQGYLRHSIREAGGDIDKILDAGAIEMLYRCSEGIPRVVNNLCESALAMAAAERKGPLNAQFIQQIAKDALGIEVVLPAASMMRTTSSAPEPPSQPDPPVATQLDIESTQPHKQPGWMMDRAGDDEEEIPGEISFEVEQTSRMRAINADKIAQAKREGKDPSTFKMAPMIRVDKEAKAKLEAAATQQDEPDDELPMLSQSMRIDAPKPATAEQMAAEKRREEAEAKARAKAEAKARAEAKAKAAAKAEAKAKAEARAKAEAKARAEARARAVAKAEAEAKAAAKAKAEAKARAEAKAEAEAKAKADAKANAKKADMPRMPDIDVLEAALAAANEGEEEPKPESSPDGDKGPDRTEKTLDGVPALTLDAALDEKRRNAAPVSPETAEGLGKAESLRDLTESMAETLFGNAEFKAIAAEVAAKPPAANEAKDKPETAAAAPASPGSDENAPAGNDPSLVLELVPDTLAGKPGEQSAPDKKMGMSTTRRLDLIKQLNSGGAGIEDIAMGDTAGPKAAPRKKADEPASLEDQFKTEMTATLKTIDVTKDAPTDADDGESKKKTGLFSRFSRSS